ncbi:uncharacterized protein BKCO1_5000129 [Diplodia corticola]|uniref:RING-type domain-containing protein n=1 Tax=Diplodia corticola TaxID=236234 RepID=A0A1J9R8T7_9PEZI|nr:uncharacterized protein BKCO1_5000129 [Diplodia corticola]OJD37974.1 hypothetical protein BKCO1_5000129 [Diplodia corticola]
MEQHSGSLANENAVPGWAQLNSASQLEAPVHPYSRLPLVILIPGRELEQRNEHNCPICRMRFDPKQIAEASATDALGRHCMLVKSILNINNRLGNHPTRRNMLFNLLKRWLGLEKKPAPVKEEAHSFAQLKKLFAEAEPTCPGPPVMLQCGHVFGAQCLFDDIKTQKANGGCTLCAYCRQPLKWNIMNVQAYGAIYDTAMAQSTKTRTRYLAVAFTKVLVEARDMASRLADNKEWKKVVGAHSRSAVLTFKARRRIRGYRPYLTRDLIDPEIAFQRLSQEFIKTFPNSSEADQRLYMTFIKVVIGRVIDEQLWNKGLTIQ